jgi:hypothetical protein
MTACDENGTQTSKQHDTSGSLGGEYEDDSLLGYSAV